MSLEESLKLNTEALNRNSELLEKLVARAEGAAAAAKSAPAEEKPAATRKKAEKTAEPAAEAEKSDEAPALTHDQVKAVLGPWIGEFKANEKDPETEARHRALRTALGKLTGKEDAKLPDVPVADLPRVLAWLDKKKAADEGHGVGRLTAKPEAADIDI